VSSYISAVNQKLLYARQLLALARAPGTVANVHQQAATTQSVAVQLHQAWLWHCCHVAETYKLQNPEAVTDGDLLVTLLAEQGKSPGEASELQTLQHTPGSWLSELLNAYRHIYQLPIVRRAEMDVDRLPMIALDAPESIDWSLERAEIWLHSLEELIDRQREMMLEF